MGKDAILFHHSVTDDDSSTGSQYVDLWGSKSRSRVLSSSFMLLVRTR